MSHSPNDDQVQFFLENQTGHRQSEAANNDDRSEGISENQTLWFSHGSQRRYACDRCRGHKLRCNRDSMASSSKPCQRCIKAKAECTISPSFRPGKSNAQKQDSANHSGRKRKINASSLGRDEERNIFVSGDSVMDDGPPAEQTWSPLIEQPSIPERSSSSQRNASSRSSAEMLDSMMPPLSYHEQQDGDILQLLSIPWMDMINTDFDPEGEPAWPYDNVLGQPLPSTVAGGRNGGLSNNPGLPNYASLSASNRCDTNQTDKSMNTRRTISQTDAPVSTDIDQLMHPTETQSDPSGTSPSTSPRQLNSIEELRSTLGSISTRLPNYPLTRSTSPILMNRKDACIQKLSNLSANLMKDLNRMIGCKLACSFVFTPSDKKTAEHLYQTADASLCHNNGIGRLFQGTELFLKLLQNYGDHLQANTRIDEISEPNSAQSPIDHSTDPQQRMETRWSVIDSYLARAKPPGMITPSSIASETSDSSSQSQCPIIDISSIIILNCYVSLLKTFEALFLSFQYILQVPSSSPLYSRLPPIIPDFHLNGFQLKTYRNLELKILIQVSRHMLDSMERAMGFASHSEGTLGGVFRDPIFQNLLQTLLRRNALDISEEDSTGMKKVRNLMASMESVLNAS